MTETRPPVVRDSPRAAVEVAVRVSDLAEVRLADAEITHLVRVISTGNWALLRREPQCFLGVMDAVHEVESYVTEQLAALTGRAIEKDELLMPV